jgi:hypothetical protein
MENLDVHGEGLDDKLDYQLILYYSSGKIHSVENASGLEISNGKEIEINGESGMCFLEIKGDLQVLREKIIVQ